MSPPTEPITRDQIEAKFRELTGGVSEEVEAKKSQALAIGLGIGLAVLTMVFLIGRRSGKRKSAVVEVRRI